jgi:hypothetical protein
MHFRERDVSTRAKFEYRAVPHSPEHLSNSCHNPGDTAYRGSGAPSKGKSVLQAANMIVENLGENTEGICKHNFTSTITFACPRLVELICTGYQQNGMSDAAEKFIDDTSGRRWWGSTHAVVEDGKLRAFELAPLYHWGRRPS